MISSVFSKRDQFCSFWDQFCRFAYLIGLRDHFSGRAGELFRVRDNVCLASFALCFADFVFFFTSSKTGSHCYLRLLTTYSCIVKLFYVAHEKVLRLL